MISYSHEEIHTQPLGAVGRDNVHCRHDCFLPHTHLAWQRRAPILRQERDRRRPRQVQYQVRTRRTIAHPVLPLAPRLIDWRPRNEYGLQQASFRVAVAGNRLFIAIGFDVISHHCAAQHRWRNCCSDVPRQTCRSYSHGRRSFRCSNPRVRVGSNADLGLWCHP